MRGHALYPPSPDGRWREQVLAVGAKPASGPLVVWPANQQTLQSQKAVAAYSLCTVHPPLALSLRPQPIPYHLYRPLQMDQHLPQG